MLTSYTQATEIVVVGAGPYGLSLAAHLREHGIPFRIFGKAMQTWATQMPAGMCLRSALQDSNLSAGKDSYTLGAYLARQGSGLPRATASTALKDFVGYGEDFAHQFVPDLETDHIRAIDRQQDLFRLTTETGERLLSRRVVIATGLNYLQHVPHELRHLPSARVTHPSQHSAYSGFGGRDVTVLGAGASALDAARLLHEAGARVTLIARTERLKVEDMPAGLSGVASERPLDPRRPHFRHHLPEAARRLIDRSQDLLCGDRAMQERLGGFPVLLGCRVHAVEPADGACERLRITLTDGKGQVRQQLTSHLIAATGYRYDKDRLRMLSQSLREQIRVGREGAPKLNRGFESSVPGLYFTGPLAAPSLGASLRSVAGSAFAAGRITATLESSLATERQHRERRVDVAVLAQEQRRSHHPYSMRP